MMMMNSNRVVDKSEWHFNAKLCVVNVGACIIQSYPVYSLVRIMRMDANNILKF